MLAIVLFAGTYKLCSRTSDRYSTTPKLRQLQQQPRKRLDLQRKRQLRLVLLLDSTALVVVTTKVPPALPIPPKPFSSFNKLL
jgi:hypothetical protein